MKARQNVKCKSYNVKSMKGFVNYTSSLEYVEFNQIYLLILKK